jgi:hypothetical protein
VGLTALIDARGRSARACLIDVCDLRGFAILMVLARAILALPMLLP